MRIGFIGLGRMGASIARHLQAAGHALLVHDVRREAAAAHIDRGAGWADTPAALAAGSDLVLTCLPGPAEVEATVLGAGGVLEGLQPGAIYVDLSSSSPTLIRTIAARLAQRGCIALDAPISGGVTGAEKGTLQVMVGGDAAAYERVRPVLDCFGSRVSHMGDVGSGTVAKLVHNLIYIATRNVLAEGFTLGVKAGVRPEALLEAVQGSAFGQGLLLSHYLPEMVFKGSFEPVRFAMKLARKDVALATALAREVDVPMPFAALTEQVLVEAVARGWGDHDYGEAFLLQEERAGVQVRAGQASGPRGPAQP